MLTWTTAKPTQPGWYWWRWLEFEKVRLGHSAQVVFVDIGADAVYWTPNEFALRGGEWAGPLEPPKEE